VSRCLRWGPPDSRPLVVCAPRDQAANTNSMTTVVNIRPGSERVAASGWRVTGVVSHTDVVKMLAENKATALGANVAKTVEDLELNAVRRRASSPAVTEPCCGARMAVDAARTRRVCTLTTGSVVSPWHEGVYVGSPRRFLRGYCCCLLCPH